MRQSDDSLVARRGSRFRQHDPVEQRFSFNEAAFAYGEARPGYPNALIDDVISYAGLQLGDRIFEVGCATGQAAESFARRGYEILATDPGSELLRGARALGRTEQRSLFGTLLLQNLFIFGFSVRKVKLILG